MQTKKRNRIKLGLAAAGSALAMAASLGAGSASAATTAWSGCVSGDICLYSGANGTGSVCVWDGDMPKWTDVCSWADEKNAVSIWNRGTGGAGTYRHVKFYLGDYYTNFYACAAQGFKGNTGPDAGAPIRSFKWATSC